MVAKAVIIDDIKINTVFIENSNYVKSSIKYKDNRQIRINEVLPFRIRFTDIRIPGYNSNNVPGIGLQIIGYSNYIL
jgi:hypothetical protein